MPLPFISRKKYSDLTELCSREQGRVQEAEHRVKQLIGDNDMLARLAMHYKKRADRAEYALNHPRQHNGQFSRIIPITKVELKS